MSLSYEQMKKLREKFERAFTLAVDAVEADAECPESEDGSGYHDHVDGCGCNMLVPLSKYEAGSKLFSEAIADLFNAHPADDADELTKYGIKPDHDGWFTELIVAQSQPTVVIVRHPEYENAIETYGNVKIVEIDLGCNFDISHPDPEEDVDEIKAFIDEARKDVADLPEGHPARNSVQGTIEQVLEAYDMTEDDNGDIIST